MQPRDRRHDFDDSAMRDWRRNDAVSAVFYAGLSSLFPQGERFFIQSIRPFQGRTSGVLAEQVRAFIGQEAIHSREHTLLNAQVTACGYDFEPLDARTEREIKRMNRHAPLRRLALTVGLEHFTAVLARHLLSEPAHLAPAPSEAARLWRWHSAEEIEHRAVAFDTMLTVTEHRSALWRWTFRCGVYLEAVARLFRVMTSHLEQLRRQHGAPDVSWPAILRYLLLRPGLLRRMTPDLLVFFAPGYHPSGAADDRLAEAALAAL